MKKEYAIWDKAGKIFVFFLLFFCISVLIGAPLLFWGGFSEMIEIVIVTWVLILWGINVIMWYIVKIFEPEGL